MLLIPSLICVFMLFLIYLMISNAYKHNNPSKGSMAYGE